MADDRLRIEPIDDLHLAISQYESILERERLEDQLELARDLAASLEAEIHGCPNHAYHRQAWIDEREDL